MNIQRVLGRQVSLAAAATFALGLATGGAAGATSSQQPSASVANDTLTIRGTNGGDAIQLGLAAGDPNTLLIDFGSATLAQSFDRRTFSAIAVFLRGGDDQFHALRTNGSFADEALTVDGGSGNDLIVVADGTNTLSGGTGDDNIRGGDGSDIVFGGSGNDLVAGGRGNDTVILGSGADTAVWNPGDNNDLIVGGAGSDTLAFNGSNANEIMSLSANAKQAVFLRDVGGVRMDLKGVEKLNLATFAGADSVTVNDLTGTDIRQANIDLSAQGGGDAQADTVTVNGTNRADTMNVDANNGAVAVSGLRARTHIAGSEPVDRLQVNSLGGNDRVGVSNAATALIGVAVDLGSGQR